jgi:hypothetical protein
MKKIFMMVFVILVASTVAEAKLKFKEKFTLTEYLSMGSSSLTIEAVVDHNGKKCTRTYVSGYMGSEETNSCSKKVIKERHRIGYKLINPHSNKNGKPTKEVSWNLESYMDAYEALTGKDKYKAGYSVIHAINSSGVEIYCTSNMKKCKTKAEIYGQ